MNPYELFGTDKQAEETGITLDYGAFSLRIRRAGGANKLFGQIIERKMKPHRRQIDNGTIDDAVLERIMAEAYSEAVVVGWTGVTDRSGAALEFSKENCTKLFLDLPDLFRDVQAQASRAAAFRAEELKADEKNSEPVSAGSLTMGTN